VSYQRALSELGSQSRPCSCTRCSASAEHMVDPSTIHDVLDTAKDVYETWEQLPETTKEAIKSTARALWPDLKALQFRRLIATAYAMFAPERFRQLAAAARPAYVSSVVRRAGANIGLPAPGSKRSITYSPGMSPTQVRAYHRRQRARGRVPGRATQRRQRESEAQAEWESSEPNYGTPYGLPRR